VDKVRRYLAVADFLHRHRAAGKMQPLEHFTAGRTLSRHHLTGAEWVEERKTLDEVRKRFEAQLGPLTALHTMMDLSLNTIKPDRVMAYLFSQLGWLQTLPASLSKEEVMAAYIRDEVTQEMTIRADVLAASLDKAGYDQAHRLLDIWFVKYGQDPEEFFGITTNLQQKCESVREVFDELDRSQSKHVTITVDEARSMWPMQEFAAVAVRGATGGSRQLSGPQTKTKTKIPRVDAERLFMIEAVWKLNFCRRWQDCQPGRSSLIHQVQVDRTSQAQISPSGPQFPAIFMAFTVRSTPSMLMTRLMLYANT